MKLAILGGSFNPVHKGHLLLASQAAAEYGYNRVLFIPARFPPHKVLSAGASADDRLQMLRLALLEYGNGCFMPDECELQREGPSYTIDTVRDLERRYAGSLDGKIGLIIGSDLASDFSKWKDAGLLAEKTTVILGRRPDINAEQIASVSAGAKTAEADFAWPHVKLHNDLYTVSSEQIRRLIAEKKDWRELVPACVYRYIVQRKLYGCR